MENSCTKNNKSNIFFWRYCASMQLKRSWEWREYLNRTWNTYSAYLNPVMPAQSALPSHQARRLQIKSVQTMHGSASLTTRSQAQLVWFMDSGGARLPRKRHTCIPSEMTQNNKFPETDLTSHSAFGWAQWFRRLHLCYTRKHEFFRRIQLG